MARGVLRGRPQAIPVEIDADPRRERASFLPAISHSGRCLTCAARLLSGAVDNSRAESYLEEDRRQAFVLLCTARP